jgi:hypothetical protein
MRRLAPVVTLDTRPLLRCQCPLQPISLTNVHLAVELDLNELQLNGIQLNREIFFQRKMKKKFGGMGRGDGREFVRVEKWEA